MSNINEELIGQDSLEEETEVSDFLTDEEIMSEIAGANDLNEQLLNGEDNLEDLQDEEEGTDETLLEDITEQEERIPIRPARNRNRVSTRRARNRTEDRKPKASVSEANRSESLPPVDPQVATQTTPSESQTVMDNLDFILDIPLQIDIQLGQTKMPLREVLEISSGSIIKLNKSENDPVELLINGKLIAEGQIVVSDGNTLGIQVSSIVNRVERIRSLK